MMRILITCSLLICSWGLSAQTEAILLGDVIISEVMANPVGLTELPETEYVEIYNASDANISLDGWTFVYDKTAVSLPDTVLPAGGYAVLYRAGRDIFVESGSMELAVPVFPANLSNAGKALKIINSLGLTVDSVDYAAAKPARAWERDDEGDFYLSSDPRGGTPGMANSPKEPPPLPSEPDDSNPGDVIISEVMANPAGLAELPETEYVEIYNASDADISLNGWTFFYDKTAVSLPDTMLPAGGYAVLYRAGRDIFVESTGMNLPVATFPSNLANTGKTLQIINSLGLMIDFVDYAAAKPACAWERDDEGDFYLSNDPKGGTPGATNSPKEPPSPPVEPDNSNSGDVIISEVMANPAGLAELPETEYVEIYNTSDMGISLNGWTFVYDKTAVFLPDTVLLAGSYAVLYRTGRDIFVESGGMNLPVPAFPASLANTGKTLKIINSIGITIDLVDYAAAKPARSWERDDEGGFYLSNDPKGGTPGVANSPKELPPPSADPDNSNPGDVIISEVMANPMELTELPETEYVEIYNTSGRIISLNGWTFVYDNRAVALPDTALSAGSYAVLYRAGRDIFIESGGMNLPVSAFPSSLANTGKTLKIINSIGITIDLVDYAAAKPARSWERDVEGEFYLSNGPKGGTPGAANSPKELPPPPADPDNSDPGDVIINEIMANPVGLAEFPETEYVEIYNASGRSISLSGWTFIYDNRAVALPDTTLFAGSYAILYRAERDIFVESGGMNLPVPAFPSSLANTGKTLKIINSLGLTIDSVDYAEAKPARAWERDGAGYFYLSNDPKGGTPGAANSPKELPPPPADTDNSNPGDVIINEIMANPAGLTELPETEYVEICNASGRNISMNGWIFVYDNRAVALPDTTLSAGGYAVLYRASQNIFVESGGMNLPVATFPSSLANTGKTLKIINSTGMTIDSVEYAEARPARAWERDDDGNFYLSNDLKGGTPGASNSPKELLPPPANPDNSNPGDVIINEVMANPTGLTEFPETEYVEILNASDTDISLSGWTFVYDSRAVTLPNTTLFAGSYAVLYRAGQNIFVESGGVDLPVSAFPSSLANTGKMLKIINSTGMTIDSVEYAEARPARAWERDDEGYFYPSNDPRGGTPGAINSLKYIWNGKEIIFNEILPEPFEGGSEYIELYNRSEHSLFVFNLAIATRKSDGTLDTRYPLSSITVPVPPNGYMVLTASRKGVLDFYAASAEPSVYEVRLPLLNNTGSTLILLSTSDETVIDEVSYSHKWHDIAIKTAKGVALERIDPDAASQDAVNWTSAISMVGYGTPGYRNSQSGQTGTTLSVSAPEYMPETNEYRIAYQVDQAGYRCRLQIFTLEGARVAEIASNQLVGTDGEIYWNGYGSDESRLHAGLYIFHAELYHPDGKRKAFKKAFLVRP